MSDRMYMQMLRRRALPTRRTAWLVRGLLSVALALLPVLSIALSAAPATAQDDLSESYTTLDGSLTIRYPAGWVVDEQFGTVILANSAEAASAINEIGQLEPGQVAIAIVPPPALTQLLGPMNLTVSDTPRALIESYIALLGPDQFEALEELSAGDKAVVGARGTVDGEPQAFYAIDLGGALTLAAVATAPGEAGQFDDLFLRIVAAMSYEAPPAPTETGSVVWQQQFGISEMGGAEGDTGGTEGDAAATTTSDLVAVAVGPDDTIYVADSMGALYVFAPDGSQQTVPGSSTDSLTFLVSMDIGPDGQLWALDGFFDAQLVAINPDGSVGETIPLADLELSLFGTHLTVGPDGLFYVLNPAEGTEDEPVPGVVHVFDASGTQVRRFEVGASEFFYEAAMDFGPDGNLYVAENFGAPGIKVYTPDGTLLNENLAAGVLFGGTVALAAAPDGSIFAAVPQSPVFHISADGTLLGAFGESQFSAADISYDAETFPAFEPGVFYEIRGLAALSTGDVIVIDNNPSFAQIVRISFSASE